MKLRRTFASPRPFLSPGFCFHGFKFLTIAGLRVFSIYPFGLNRCRLDWQSSLTYSAQDRPVIYADGRCRGRLDQFQPDTIGESEKRGGEEEDGGEGGGKGVAGASLKLAHPDWPGLLQHGEDRGWQKWFLSGQETFLKATSLPTVLLHHHLLLLHLHHLLPHVARLPLSPDPGGWPPDSWDLSEQASVVWI